MQKIVIIGSGGFAKEVAFLIKEINKQGEVWDFCGYITNDQEFVDSNPKMNSMSDDWLLNLDDKINVVFGIGNPSLIKKLLEKFSVKSNYIFPNLISPTANGDWDEITLGKGNIITSGNIFTTDITIGDFNIFNLNCTIGHDSTIKNYNVINPSVNISGGVEIGNENLLGTGTQVLQYKKINSRIIVGAGSVVTKDLEEAGVYVGTPAKKIK